MRIRSSALAMSTWCVAMSMGCAQAVTLHAPTLAPSAAREDATRVDVEPITTSSKAIVETPSAPLASSPALVLTSGIAAELGARALHGGEPGGYQMRCVLERFAVRVASDISDARAIAAVYVDLRCDAVRASDRVLVWRGMLRGRSAAAATTTLSADSGLVQQMLDRAMSDVSRELASDLVLRVLGLRAGPSQRVFADQDEAKARGGLDDTPFGALALSEAGTAPPVGAEEMAKLDVVGRAAAWNAIAMGAGPGEPWLAGDRLRLDDEAFVRFQQYKALARLASPRSLSELRAAADTESDKLCAELVKDALQSGGVGVARSSRATNASAVTNGTSTSP
jgi:hypothetical protein